jgi:hypothetical protein
VRIDPLRKREDSRESRDLHEEGIEQFSRLFKRSDFLKIFQGFLTPIIPAHAKDLLQKFTWATFSAS